MMPEPLAEVMLPPCSYCGNRVEGGLCFSHQNPDRDWAASNRAMCDFVHRGVIQEAPPAGPLPERPGMTFRITGPAGMIWPPALLERLSRVMERAYLNPIVERLENLLAYGATHPELPAEVYGRSPAAMVFDEIGEWQRLASTEET